MYLCLPQLAPAWRGGGGGVVGGGVLLRILGVGVPSSYPNLDPVSDQRMSFPTFGFRPGLCCSKRG